MKKHLLLAVLLLAVLVGIIFSTATYAGTTSPVEAYATENAYLVYPNGSVQEVPLSPHPATPEEARAIAHPNMEVPVGLPKTKILRVDFFHGLRIREYSGAIIFDGKKITPFNKCIAIEEKQTFILPNIFLMLVSMGLMTVSIVLATFYKGNSDLVDFAIAVVAIAATVTAEAAFFAAVAIAAFFAAVAIAAFFAAFAITVAIFAAAFVKNTDRIFFLIMVAIYYLFAVISLVV